MAERMWPEPTSPAIRIFAATVMGILSTAVLSVASVAAARLVASRTSSGLFGICGPYGDDWSINLQLFLFAVAFIGSPVLGICSTILVLKRNAMKNISRA
jgi:hypothetical protein